MIISLVVLMVRMDETDRMGLSVLPKTYKTYRLMHILVCG